MLNLGAEESDQLVANPAAEDGETVLINLSAAQWRLILSRDDRALILEKAESFTDKQQFLNWLDIYLK